MNCPYCTTKLFENDRECPRWGAPIRTENKEIKSPKSFNPPHHDVVAIAVQGGDRKFKVGTLWEIGQVVYAVPSTSSPYLMPLEWLEIEIDDSNVLWRNSECRIYCAKRGSTRISIYLKDNRVISTEINILVE